MVDQVTSARPPLRVPDGASVVVATGVWLLVVVGAIAWGATSLASGEPWWHVPVATIILLGPASVGAMLAAHLPGNPVGWLILLPPASTAVAKTAEWVALNAPSSWAVPSAWLDATLWALGVPLLPMLGLLFPDGHTVGRVGRWGLRAAVAGVGLVVVTSAVAPGELPPSGEGATRSSNPLGVDAVAPLVRPAGLLAALLLVAAAGAALYSLSVRWSRNRSDDRLAITAAGAPLAVALALVVATQVFALGGDAAASVATLLAAVGVPIGIGLAVSRYRLYRLDLALTGALAYAVAVAAMATIYAAASIGLGLLVGQHSTVTVAVSTAMAAATFMPLLGVVRSCVRRRVLGVSGDPDRAASAVARGLATADDPDRIVESIERVLTEVLHVPPVQIWLPRMPGEPESTGIPLQHHGILVGRLLFAPSRSAAMRRTQLGVADPVAAALHAASLSDKVRRSRTDLVVAVEEERRRLRRDLHDGLGPRLATLGMGLDTAGNRVRGTSLEPVMLPLLTRLRSETDEMLVELRRIAAGLRPPSLDEFGLVRAVQLEAAELARSSGLRLRISTSGDIGSLPASVEVAAYRIAIEAVLNCARHSHAQVCEVQLCRDHGLGVTVRDDGTGPPTDRHEGVGVQSMRERAVAVGGWLAFESAAPHGTEVRAWLPVTP